MRWRIGGCDGGASAGERRQGIVCRRAVELVWCGGWGKDEGGVMGALVLVGFGAFLGFYEDDVFNFEEQERDSVEVVGECGGQDGAQAIDGRQAIGGDVVDGVEDWEEDVEEGFVGGGGFGGGEAFNVVSGWVGCSGGCALGCGGACFFVFVFVFILGARFLGGDGGEWGVVIIGSCSCCFGGGDWDGFERSGLG